MSRTMTMASLCVVVCGCSNEPISSLYDQGVAAGIQQARSSMPAVFDPPPPVVRPKPPLSILAGNKVRMKFTVLKSMNGRAVQGGLVSDANHESVIVVETRGAGSLGAVQIVLEQADLLELNQQIEKNSGDGLFVISRERSVEPSVWSALNAATSLHMNATLWWQEPPAELSIIRTKVKP